MSTLGMMLPILLLLLPLAAFADDGPTDGQGWGSAKLLKSITKREGEQAGRPCDSGKWCYDDCCETSNCECQKNNVGYGYCASPC
uniref:Ctr_108_N conopeptide n=1 Tax=Conus tribblei TaxID=101761 RepID=A0A0C9S5U2_CONTD